MKIKIQRRMQLNFMRICLSIIVCMMEQQIRRKCQFEQMLDKIVEEMKQ